MTFPPFWDVENSYPNDTNAPSPSFISPVPPPDVDPDGGTLLHVIYSVDWRETLMGACDQLLLPSTWQGSHDEILLAMGRAANLKSLLAFDHPADAETPFWDSATDVDDDEPATTQEWYGTVTNPEGDRAGMTFTENLLVWVFTGLLAVSGTPAAAILFHTIAPRMVIATRGGDLGEIIRIFLDGQEAARVDTTGHAGEIINTPIAADPAISAPHELLIVKMS